MALGFYDTAIRPCSGLVQERVIALASSSPWACPGESAGRAQSASASASLIPKHGAPTAKPRTDAIPPYAKTYGGAWVGLVRMPGSRTVTAAANPHSAPSTIPVMPQRPVHQPALRVHERAPCGGERERGHHRQVNAGGRQPLRPDVSAVGIDADDAGAAVAVVGGEQGHGTGERQRQQVDDDRIDERRERRRPIVRSRHIDARKLQHSSHKNKTAWDSPLILGHGRRGQNGCFCSENQGSNSAGSWAISS